MGRTLNDKEPLPGIPTINYGATLYDFTTLGRIEVELRIHVTYGHMHLFCVILYNKTSLLLLLLLLFFYIACLFSEGVLDSLFLFGITLKYAQCWYSHGGGIT
jgi:hypothetical protein